MDKKYKDIHIIDKTGKEIFTRRECISVCVKDNLVIYTTERNTSILLGEVGTTIHELLITNTEFLKVIID